MITPTQIQCKVCNSKHRGLIEEMAEKKLSPQRIYERLQSMTDPVDIRIVAEEDIKPSSIKRHLERHWDKVENRAVVEAKARAKVKRTRDNYEAGKRITIDGPNVLAHLIELALARLEETESLADVKKHEITAKYLGQIATLVDKLNKVSGQVQQEGKIDAGFFQTEVTTLAEIVLATIRSLDMQFNLNFKLEVAFREEFEKHWVLYHQRQQMIIDGELPPTDGEKERNINRFNNAGNMV